MSRKRDKVGRQCNCMLQTSLRGGVVVLVLFAESPLDRFLYVDGYTRFDIKTMPWLSEPRDSRCHSHLGNCQRRARI